MTKKKTSAQGSKGAQGTKAKIPKASKGPLPHADAKPAKGDKSKPAKPMATKGKPVAAKAAPSQATPSKAPVAGAAKTVPPPSSNAAGSKSGRKGITVVTQKPHRPPAARKSAAEMASLGSTMPKLSVTPRKPLIPSGPKNAVPGSGLGELGDKSLLKSPFTKKEIDRFKKMLLAKRAELIGDVSSMEGEALKGQSGSLSHLPQHMAEQGSDTYDQSLALDLAAADRKLIQEIDDALARIENGSYGVCQMTGKPIRPERLEELPWARYSIDAARAMERRSV